MSAAEPEKADALRLVRGRGGATRLLVIRHGRQYLDERIGCSPDALFWMFSAGKPFIAVLVHKLAESGVIELDAPVARYWPEFAQYGKGSVTTRRVLQHRSGMAVATSSVGDALAMTNWERSVRHVAHARLRWPVGAVPAYQYLAFGFILGEIVQRVTRLPVADALRMHLLEPLGLHNTYLGVPSRELYRCVPIRGTTTVGRVAAIDLNRRSLRQAVIPAAGISTTAEDVARFYSMLLAGGELDGVRILSQSTITRMLRPSSNGELDRYAKAPVRWSEGLQLGGARHEAGFISPLGELSSKQAFGHNGSNCCVAWADPTRGLVFVHLTNRLGEGLDAIGHHSAVADAVIASCDATDVAADIGADG
ncbi:beta-lactamase family protein [Planctomonas sp. JC2975]|uniref:serine hydrolase n=1 Tax=Planctomonas sp. JC2975 TaxID=2729626 RepID=UPI00147588F6|nr:beta-lactamase family protein [Planctomonas sp. JC2975]